MNPNQQANQQQNQQQKSQPDVKAFDPSKKDQKQFQGNDEASRKQAQRGQPGYQQEDEEEEGAGASSKQNKDEASRKPSH